MVFQAMAGTSRFLFGVISDSLKTICYAETKNAGKKSQINVKKIARTQIKKKPINNHV